MNLDDLRTLLLDLSCMTALRHVLDNPAISALVNLCCACVDDRSDEEKLTLAYCTAYNAWLEAVSRGRGGFARQALDEILFRETPVARLCSGREKIPYSVLSAMGHDLETLGKLTGIEPAMFLLLCERAGMPGQHAVRLPVWEPMLGEETPDPRTHLSMLSRNGTDEVIRFFATQGTGLFARYPAATYVGVSADAPQGLRGVERPDPIRLSELVRYERQRGVLEENTRRLLAGQHAGNVLLYGDKGTGKSATVKALLQQYWSEGLRIVEVQPQHLTHLQELFSLLRSQPCRFIVFVDDLAFNDSCPEYTALKTVLEGGLEARPENVVVYATSNRRNIVRQRFSEREDDVNTRDTLEEKFSLADRFDIRLTFTEPDMETYFAIARDILAMRGLEAPDNFDERARTFSMTHSGRSPRVARQFVDALEVELRESAAEAASGDEAP